MTAVTPMTIWKFPAPVEDEFSVSMPMGATVLAVQVQSGTPCIWALVDPAAPAVLRRFALRGTGHPADGLDGASYVGSYQYGALVFHLFDRGAGPAVRA